MPLLDGLRTNYINIWCYCVTEMVNNALGNSDGSDLTVIVREDIGKPDSGAG
jgi:hypothetical protein